MAKKVTITLTVNASILYQIENPSNAEVDGNCSILDDNHGTSYNGTIAEFKSEVYLGHDVVWTGRTKGPEGIDSGYSVSIGSHAWGRESCRSAKGADQ